jgi:hypothetical protein
MPVVSGTGGVVRSAAAGAVARPRAIVDEFVDGLCQAVTVGDRQRHQSVEVGVHLELLDHTTHVQEVAPDGG